MHKQTIKILILILSFIGLLVFAYWLRDIFLPLVISFLIAYILNPLVNYLEKKGVSRLATIIGIYIVFFSVIVFTLIFLIPVVTSEVKNFYNAAPSYIEKVKGWGEKLVAEWNEKHPERRIDWDNITKEFKSAFERNSEHLVSTGAGITGLIFDTILSGLWGIFIFISYILLIPIYTFFLMLNLNKIRDKIFLYLPSKQKDRVITILSRIDRVTASFFRGKLFICVIKGLLTSVGLYIIGIRFALLFGFIQIFASFVPYLPLIIVLIPAEFIAVLDIGFSVWHILAVCILFAIIEVIEGIILTPIILGKETGLHPIYIILSLFIGGALFGFFGLIAAIPVACIIKILIQELLEPQSSSVKS